VNGISRIGFMTGGQDARWVDEEMADVFIRQATRFVQQSRDQPFFLFFSTHDIHVPRAPHARFVGATPHGPRGDALVEFDWCVGQIVDSLRQAGVSNDTLIIVTSDNGPVLDDGYQDQAAERIGDHRPAGVLRGGKYSNFEGGTRVPWIVHWPRRVRPGVSDAIVSQVDLPRSLASLVGFESLASDTAPDSQDVLPALLGDSDAGRQQVVLQGRSLALRQGDWKYIEASPGPAINRATNTELGNSDASQLYHLRSDPGETRNLASEKPERASQMADMLKEIREQR
ncbi:MAG: sulfatase-like hydrolase/transferase, partial [Planctomycetota bacterium]